MKRIILAVIICMLFAAPVFAGCTAKEDTWMYLETESFFAWARVARINVAQAVAMLMQDGREGNAVFVRKGTHLSLIEKIDEHISVLEYRGTPMIALNAIIRCD